MNELILRIYLDFVDSLRKISQIPLKPPKTTTLSNS